MIYKDFPWEEIIKWVKFWKNKNNWIAVLAIHYSSDPDKDPERKWKTWYDEEKRITPKENWIREMEIWFERVWSRRVFWPEYCDYNEAIHIIPSYTITWWERILSLDFWQSNASCALIWVYKWGCLYIIDELYKPAIPSAFSNEMRIKFEQYIWPTTDDPIDVVMWKVDLAFPNRVIDPTTKNKNRVKDTWNWEIPYSIIQEFYDNGFDFKPWNNDVNSWITKLREMMRINPKTWKPRLFIFWDKCPNLIREIRKYRYKKQTEKDEMEKNVPDVVVKIDDHAVDSLRYMAMEYLHEPEDPPEEKTKIQKDFERATRKPVFVNPINY